METDHKQKTNAWSIKWSKDLNCCCDEKQINWIFDSKNSANIQLTRRRELKMPSNVQAGTELSNWTFIQAWWNFHTRIDEWIRITKCIQSLVHNIFLEQLGEIFCGFILKLLKCLKQTLF